MSLHKWEFYEDNKGEFRWRRIALNGLIVGASPRSFKTHDQAIDDAKLNGYSEEEL